MEAIYEQLMESEQAKLDAEGFGDLKFVVGYFRHGDNIRLEARLDGHPARKAEAKKILSFSPDAEV